jgi:hypothetical protein
MAQHLAYWRPLQARRIVIVLGPVDDLHAGTKSLAPAQQATMAAWSW